LSHPVCFTLTVGAGDAAGVDLHRQATGLQRWRRLREGKDHNMPSVKALENILGIVKWTGAMPLAKALSHR
jgi:hypothetical protein